MSEKCPIIAIDPGNRQSAYCVIDCNTLRPLEFGKVDNEELRSKLVFANEQGWQWAAIEMVASYGMAVGREVFDTVLWIGRFYEELSIQMAQKPRLLCRIEEKRHICHNSRANDAAIRRALIDRFADHDLKNGRGTKKNPDFFYGFKADVWAAYAVGLTAIENRENDYAYVADAKAQARQEYLNTLYDQYNNVLVESAENETKLATAQAKVEKSNAGILQLRGVRPFLSDKYDLTQHPNYKMTSDADPQNALDIEKYLSHKEKIHPDDQFVLVDVDSLPPA